MVAKAEVDNAPFVPLPAAIGFYVAVWTVVQFGLVQLSEHVAWLQTAAT
jgi:hypothetical protein